MDTIVAPITPLLHSPVIVIRISGSDAHSVSKLLTKADGTPIAELTHGYMHHYRFALADGGFDDVMAVYFKAPHSYTGEDTLEISFHGNPIIVTKALSAIYDLGIRAAMNGEFSKQAFLNGKLDLTQAEAVQSLIAAKTEKGVYYAYEQLHGSVRKSLDMMMNKLLEVLAVIEAKIDFPDDETGDDDVTLMLVSSVTDVLADCNRLLESYRSLRIFNDGLTVVLAGKPNVGKSSLMNALLGSDRSIVSAEPGTTRDYISEELLLGDMPVKIIDTAGLRKALDDAESQGVDRSELRIRSADIVLVVLDLSGVLNIEDAKVLELTESCNRLIVGNKSDEYRLSNFVPADIIVSAKKGHNIDKLIQMIRERAGMHDFEKLSGTATVTERHAYSLRVVIMVLTALLVDIEKKPLDMVAIDLNMCVSQFEEITGKKYTEDILDIIFSKFCIGK